MTKESELRVMRKQSELRVLLDAELDGVHGGKITVVNGGGNTPNGGANGVPRTNPAGQEPPGQQP
jgi:hypothetical protein